jgi:SPP1 family predicted phage head-tail adaptor
MKPLMPGRLRIPVVIQRPVYATKENGERVATWETVTRAYASIEPLQGQQLERAKAFGATVTHKMITRWQQGISPDMRVVFGNRKFSITAALNVEEANRELDIYATEVIGG